MVRVGLRVGLCTVKAGLPNAESIFVLFLQYFDADKVVRGFWRIKNVRVESGGDGVKPAQERGRGGVEPFVADAEDLAVADGAEGLPVTLLDDAFEGDTITGAAPCGEDEVGIGGGDGLRRSGGTGEPKELAASGLDEFADPVLGVNERLTPFFTIDARAGQRGGADADGFDGGLHLRDEGIGPLGGVGDGGDEADVVVDVC